MKNRKLRAKDISKLYSVSESTVWLYVKQKKINSYKISSRVTVFDFDEIEKFFSTNLHKKES